MMPTSYHTGLLWALESLAWFPEYISRASLILAKLSAIDPGGTLSNRPINSLTEIFKPWHYQTLASFEVRMQVLKLIVSREPEIAWTLLIRMLPDPSGGIGQLTYKPRWRLFDLEKEKPISYKEIYDTHSAVVDLLISIFDYSESKFTKLIDESVNLFPSDRNNLLTFVEKVLPEVEQIEFTAWHTTRSILHHHRSYPDTNWALPEIELIRFEKLYEKLTPKDEIKKMIWMFNSNWLNFPEGYQHQKVSNDEQEKIILNKRITELQIIYQKFGLEKIIQLNEMVKEGRILGDALSYLIDDENEIIKLCSLCKAEKDKLGFLQGFVFRKSILNGLDWVLTLFRKLETLKYSNQDRASLLIPLIQSQKLWNYIESTNKEIINEYWKHIYPLFYGISTDEKIYGLKKLIEHGRFYSAIHACSHFVEDMPSEIIITILKKAGTENTDEDGRFDGYEVNRLFNIFDQRTDFDSSFIFELEWLFLPLLSSYSNNRKPKQLHDELSRKPEFFMEVMKWSYKPDDETIIEEERNSLTDEQIYSRAKHSIYLLSSWNKIPGVDESGNINYDFLIDWVRNISES